MGFYRTGLSASSFKKQVRHLEQRGKGGTVPAVDWEKFPDLPRIAWAVRTAARNTPWKSECLVQALAAQHLMRARGIPGALYLGAAMNGGAGDGRSLEAHAWVRCGDAFVCGENGHERFAVVSTFTWG